MKIIYSILIGTLVLAFGSCEKIVDLDLRTIEPRLVIEATITESTPCMVALKMTQDYYDNLTPTMVSGVITLTDSNGNTETLTEVAHGIYSSSMIGASNTTYSISVKVKENEYKATATIPETVPIDSLFIYNLQVGKEDYYSPCIIYSDPVDVQNNYYASIYVNNKRLRTMYLHDDEYNNGVKDIKDILFYNSEDTEDGENNDLKIGDLVRVEMRLMDRGAYEYFYSVYSIAQGSNPTSNFSGGVLGSFSAYGVSVKEITISESNIFTKDQIK